MKKPRTKKARRPVGKAAKRRKVARPARRKGKVAKSAPRKRTTRAKRQRGQRVAIVNGGRLVGPGTDIDTDAVTDTSPKLA
jgi:hypothetical protein